MNNKLILLSMLLTNMILANYSYGEEVTDETGDKKHIDTAQIKDDEYGIMRKNALAVGHQATTDGDNTVVLGSHSTVKQYGSTAVGASVTVSGINATAIGNNAKAEVDKSVALGAHSIANRSSKTMTEAFSNKAVNSEGEVSVGNDDYEKLRQITHVAGGTEDTDAVNVRQLRAVDNKIHDMQNAISHDETNAKTALTRTQQHETTASTHATNAKTALDAVSDHEAKAKTALTRTQQHETTASTHATNAKTALDAVSDHEAKAKTALDNTQQHETTASTHATNAKTVLDAVSDHETKAKTALDNTQQHETTASTHAMNAKIALDAVSDHEAKAKTALDNTQQHETTASTHATNAKTVLDAVSDHEAKAKTALDNTQQYEADFKTAIESTKNSAQLTHSSAHQARALVGQLESEVSHIGKMAKQAPDSVIHIGHDLGGNAISVAGKQGDRVLTGVTDGIRDHDAANISQLNRVNRMTTVAHALAYKNASKINNLQYELSKTNKKIDRGLATSAALTGLFQPYNVGKVNVTVGVGGYNASTAIAIGTGYRFNEYTAVKAGVAYSGENNLMYNTSFNLEW